MKYVENPDKTENSEDEDAFIKSLKKQIAAIKRNREWEGRFMLFEELLSDERKEARAEGLAEGRTEGEEVTLRLVQMLAAQNRMDDIVKATNDSEYRQKLFKEFNL